MASEAGAEQVRGIGARLRCAREKKGLTVLQAAERLHVDARLLESLETEQFSVLGAAVYARGHLRRYADLIGESPAQLQQLYEETTHTVQPDLTRIARSEPDADPSRLLVPALLILIGVALAGILWWVLSTQMGKSAALHTEPPVSVGADVAPGAPTATTTAAGTTTPLEVSASAAAPPQMRLAAPGAASRNPGTAASHAQLALRFSAASWVEVYDAGGRRLLHGVEAADSARTLAGAAPLRVVLGNAPGVALQVNGQAVALEGLVHHNGSAHILIDGTGRASAANIGAPRG